MVDLDILKSFADLYSLDVETVSDLDRMAKKSAENLVNSLERSKQTTLPRFIYGLGIREVGEATAEALANNLHSIETIMNASLEDLQQVDDVGPVVAENIRQFFDQLDNQAIVHKLVEQGVNWPVIEVSESGTEKTLDGSIYVITGTLDGYSRDEAGALLKQKGRQSQWQRVKENHGCYRR